MSDPAWQEMLDEFRALGGTADNVAPGEGPYGRGLFAVDPSRPVVIRIPENLLLPTAEVAFENGAFRVAAGAKTGAREKAFLEAYEERFSWGGGGRGETERIFEQAGALPEDLRRLIKDRYFCGDWFDVPSDKLIQDKFIAARCIRHKEHTVVMPLIELANHGPGPAYVVQEGIAIQGRFPGEVLVKYADFDAHGMFMIWGFATDQPQAFSIALGGKVGSSAVQIGRDLGRLAPSSAFWVPESTKEQGIVKLQFLMLGNRNHPRLCKAIFYRLMREAGLVGFEESFDTIRHANRIHFLDLLAALEDVDGPMARMLRRMAHSQLRALSYCYGVQPF